MCLVTLNLALGTLPNCHQYFQGMPVERASYGNALLSADGVFPDSNLALPLGGICLYQTLACFQLACLAFF